MLSIPFLVILHDKGKAFHNRFRNLGVSNLRLFVLRSKDYLIWRQCPIKTAVCTGSYKNKFSWITINLFLPRVSSDDGEEQGLTSIYRTCDAIEGLEEA
jgi:hypothetical protein